VKFGLEVVLSALGGSVPGCAYGGVPRVSPGSALFRGSWSSGQVQRRSGREVELTDPGEHDRQQVLTGWQSQGEAAAVSDQPGGHAEQFVTQPDRVPPAVLVGPGDGLEKYREVPGEQCGPLHTRFTLLCPEGR
jgi:hypothetical protein